MRLSFSAVDKYRSCPRDYKYHYIDRIRPLTKGSPLSMGGAIDTASEVYLENKDSPEARKLALDAFESEMRQEHKDNDIKYSQKDVQLELIPEDLLENLGYGEDYDTKEFLKYCKENPNNLDKDEIELLKAIQIEAIIVKGKMMLPLFFDWVDENVDIVHSCQRKVEIENGEGDTFVGYLDFEVTLKNGKRYVYDLKTSSNPKAYYPDEAADESFQLGIYSQEVGQPLVGYFVLDKNIRKREPRVRSREVRGEITEEHLDMVFDTIEEVRQDILAEKFDKNLDSCFLYGKCWAWDLCKDGSMKGLKKLKDGER